MARQTIATAVRIRTAHKAEWERLKPNQGIAALIRVLLDFYFSGKLDTLEVNAYVEDEISYVKSVDKRTK